MDANSEAKGLVGDIFQLTGQKVEMDDPIVVAALIHSQLIRRAGQDAMTAIQSSVDQAIDQLTEAVKAERQAAGELSQTTARSFSQVVEAAKAATDAEGPRLQAQFVSLAQDVLQEVRKEASAAAPAAWKIKVALGASLAVLVSALAGGILGATWFGKPALSADQARKIAAGEDFIRIIPLLDQATRDKLNETIGKSKR